MKRPAKISNPECSTCHQPMLLESVVLVDKQNMNVFKCESCDKLTAAIANVVSIAENLVRA